MPETFLPIRQLIEQAQHSPGAAQPVETHQSYPIPVRDCGSMSVVFLYCVSRLVPHDGLYLMAPSYLATLDARTGGLQELREVTPGEFGSVPNTGPSIGKDRMPEGMTPEQYLELQGQVYDDYDTLLPLFAAASHSQQEDFPRFARRFQSRFIQVAEQPLLPFYRAVGKAFWGWLGPGES